MNKHKWQESKFISPSGKLLYHCPVCGAYNPAPAKPEKQSDDCIPRSHFKYYVLLDGKIYMKHCK